ncbi:Nucleophile aminohydrolase, N-terminal [Sesbania bispinosa]|nr:Nucleophile aminohydrolase, N-terminal [Sesbania bispinosa]
MFFLQLIALLILVHFIEKVYILLGVEKRKEVVTLEAGNSDPEEEAKMLGIFKEKLVNPPKELNSPDSLNSSKKSKLPDEIIQDFVSHNPSNAFSMSFGNDAFLAYSPSNKPSIHHGLNNLSNLIKRYGLSKGTNEALFIIEAYRTLRDRSPYPADQVLKELEGSFAFVIYDNKNGTVFVASGSNGKIGFFWGIAADGSVVISENLELIKASCAKSFAPFPIGCMFHSEHGLMSYEHPTRKMKAMPRIDSEGVMCGANFHVDSQSRNSMMPRVGSEANWTTWGLQA